MYICLLKSPRWILWVYCRPSGGETEQASFLEQLLAMQYMRESAKWLEEFFVFISSALQLVIPVLFENAKFT